MNDTAITTTTISVNDNPPSWSEANSADLRKSIAGCLNDIEDARTWVDLLVTSVEEAEDVVDTIDIQGTTDELNADVVGLTRAYDAFANLALSLFTTDRALEGLITVVGADRVFSIFDRLTTPAKADIAN